ncbi:GNAT family protein [[Lactobacillus] timonensis]|jgi:putative acetyltransferase|uniref:hypothetical protein n=1 Tax=[Lactobacillus] timonensis TaxID=1970790 RepID=UPI002E25F230
MEIKELTAITAPEMAQLVGIWESAVTATHRFLSTEEIAAIKEYVPQAFQDVQHLVVAISNQQIKELMGSTVLSWNCSSLTQASAVRELAAGC